MQLGWKTQVMTSLQIHIWVWGVSLYVKTLWNFQKHACKILIVSRIIFLWTFDCGSLLGCAYKFILPIFECCLWNSILSSQSFSGLLSHSPFIPRLPPVSSTSFQEHTPWFSPSVIVFVYRKKSKFSQNNELLKCVGEIVESGIFPAYLLWRKMASNFRFTSES